MFIVTVKTSVLRQKVNFDTQIHRDVREFFSLLSICVCSPVRFGMVCLKWETVFEDKDFGKIRCEQRRTIKNFSLKDFKRTSELWVGRVQRKFSVTFMKQS